jgi:hypothetical protein
MTVTYVPCGSSDTRDPGVSANPTYEVARRRERVRAPRAAEARAVLARGQVQHQRLSVRRLEE